MILKLINISESRIKRDRLVALNLVNTGDLWALQYMG